MSYSEPQMNIFQVFEPALASNVTPLHSCDVGPMFGLHRYGISGEEQSVGAYDPAASTAYPWPGKQSGSIVDEASAKVYAKDALLKYLQESGKFSVPTGYDGENQILASTLTLQSKNGFSRSTVFGNRDVAIGDRVKVTWNAGANEVDTLITDIKGEAGSDIGTPTAESDNQAGVSPAIPPAADNAGVTDTDMVATAAGTYNGIVDGYVQETYNIQVTTLGALGTAKATVISASGTDDVSEIILVAASQLVGSRGITMTIDDNGGTALYAVGDVIVVTATQLYAFPTLTEGGAYTGNKTSKYVVQIMEGGEVGVDTPKFKVTTTNGYDIQSVTTIVDGVASIIGNYGITLLFAGQLVKGDIWTIDATPESAKAMTRIILGANLIDGVTEADSGDTLDVTLMILDNVQVDSQYFSAATTEITVLAGAGVEDTYGDTGNDLPIMEGELFIDYREQLGAPAVFGSVSDPLEVEPALGPIVPENTLAYAVYKASLNANGVPVYYMSVLSDDLTGYSDALDRISNEDIIWSLVPLTKNASVIELFQGFINTQSSPINNNWKKGWFSSNAEQEYALYTEDSLGDPIEATISDTSPLGVTDAGNYIYVNAPGAKFVMDGGVAAGDILKYNSRIVDTVKIWDSAVILSATDENLVLTSSAMDIPVASEVEVYRNASLTDFADIIAAESGGYSDRRINNVWPDVIKNELGVEVEGYFLCAALAAYRSAAAPHQPLTRAEITGFGDPDRSTMFSRTQLNTIAAGGTWIVTTNLGGAVYTRHQLTTDMTSEETQEDSITSNLDSISRLYRDNFEPIIGKGNVTPDMLELLEGRVFTSFKAIHNLPYPRELGPQMLGYELLELSIDSILRSKVRIRIKPELPLPLNYLDLFFYVGG